MPMGRHEIEQLLDELDREPKDALEDQSLDFMEWDPSSDHQSVRLAVAAAICMANSGGGTIVFGTRELTLLDRQQVNRLIHELADDGHLRIEGHGRGARHVHVGPLEVQERERKMHRRCRAADFSLPEMYQTMSEGHLRIHFSRDHRVE